MRGWLNKLRRWGQALRRDVIALYGAARDPRVPWYVKALVSLIAAYALSPIDLIPDFIPVLGYLDELILLPLAIAGVMRLLEPKILAEHRARANEIAERPVSKTAAVVIISIGCQRLRCWDGTSFRRVSRSCFRKFVSHHRIAHEGIEQIMRGACRLSNY